MGYEIDDYKHGLDMNLINTMDDVLSMYEGSPYNYKMLSVEYCREGMRQYGKYYNVLKDKLGTFSIGTFYSDKMRYFLCINFTKFNDYKDEIISRIKLLYPEFKSYNIIIEQCNGSKYSIFMKIKAKSKKAN